MLGVIDISHILCANDTLILSGANPNHLVIYGDCSYVLKLSRV
jgi:hypothetical protein